ncbi:hypothetical protein [Tenggerimyces flavus]|uniref:Nucleotidyltransferase n=1 Tax=Tenggerimyces flavus TaxID=1708749 RepID=A0ABV7YDE8_9ACTN|nr:hypothetical protein [Tenggerimyces flavus]MBM7783651.1 hypothetical protein [Tenggerimyces flavus]
MSDRSGLVAAALADPRLAGPLDQGDWYLVGSRTFGAGDELSDWDTVLLTARDGVDVPSEDVLDEIFAIRRPVVDRKPDLDLHVAWRRVGAVDLTALGPADRTEREAALTEWAFELAHAIPLRVTNGVGEVYRAQVAERFERDRPELTATAYRAFRTSRNAAVACLPRDDPAAQALTAAACAGYAARFWLLANGHAHPYDKWLLHALRRHPDAALVVAAITAALDGGSSPAQRFDALWELWRLVDLVAPDLRT